ncbi:hypothetical protein [Tamlana flava]|uniref:hypothetical protein n=1 Tax=Tamlana flava TaxID=3158572 RepID=UPI00351B4E7E
MKTFKSLLLLLMLGLLLNSCFITSLHPFYTDDVIQFEKQLIGQWIDSDNGVWNVMRFTDFRKNKTNRDTTKLNEKQFDAWHRDKQSYMIQYENYDGSKLYNSVSKKTFRMEDVHLKVVPFKINGQLFLDFNPHHIGWDEGLAGFPFSTSPKINTHSLAKLDMDSKNQITITWLTEEKINALLATHKIKIKHESTGTNGKTLLTAPPEELVEFIEKYMNVKGGDRWDSSDNQKLKFQLKRR